MRSCCKYAILCFIAFLVIVAVLAFSAIDGEPVTVRFWHCYEGEQGVILQELVDTYNATEGAEKGYRVVAQYRGSLDQLSDRLEKSIWKNLDASELPNMITVSEDAAYTAHRFGVTASAEMFLSDSVLEEYVDGFLDGGRFTSDGDTVIFPLTKTTELVFINKTLWNEFIAANPEITARGLKTWTDLAAMASVFYTWTDGLTPQTPGDGLPLMAIESVESFLFTISEQLMPSLIQAGHKEIKLNLNQESLRQIWNFYYPCVVKGEISLSRQSCCDQVEYGEVLCYIGSTSSITQFPKRYMDRMHNQYQLTELMVSQYPTYTTDRNVVPQTGNGVIVLSGTKKMDEASYDFLNWLCHNEDLLSFCMVDCSLPPLTELLIGAQRDAMVRDYADSADLTERNMAYAVSIAYDQVFYNRPYSPVGFPDSAAFKQEMEKTLISLAQQGRYQYLTYIEEGLSPERAFQKVHTEDAFLEWYHAVAEIMERY